MGMKTTTETNCGLGMHNTNYTVIQSNGHEFGVCSECTGKRAKLGVKKQINRYEWVMIVDNRDLDQETA